MQGKLETALRPQAYYWFSYDKQPAEKTGRLHVIDQFEGSPKTRAVSSFPCIVRPPIWIRAL